MKVEEQKEAVYKALDELTPRLIDISTQIHGHPETNFAEYFASDLLSRTAEKAGFVVTRQIAEVDTAFKAVYRGKPNGPVLAFLSEYDALPEVGHACGH